MQTMLKLGKQILHTLVLLITGMALIGVNVTQSGCIHSDRTYLEVRVLPAENTCPCEEECGCCQEERQFCKDCCHASSRHDFYKVTDSSLVERVLQMQLSVFTLPECGWEMTMQILDKIWDADGNFVEDNTLTVYVKRLREKLGEAIHIETVRGMGYRVD